MNLISPHTVSVIHSFYVHLLSRSELKIRWMLNLYVNFNIEAILYLKNKINASISFLMWHRTLSLLREKKIISECILPKFQSQGAEGSWRRQSGLSLGSVPCRASGFLQYRLLFQCEGSIKRVVVFLPSQWSLFTRWILGVGSGGGGGC